MTPAPEPEALFNAEIRQPAQIFNSFVCVRSFIHDERSRKLWEEVYTLYFLLSRSCAHQSQQPSHGHRVSESRQSAAKEEKNIPKSSAAIFYWGRQPNNTHLTNQERVNPNVSAPFKA